MAGATDQLEASFPRGRPNSVGCYNAQSRGVHSVTRVPCFSATGEEEAWTEVLWEPSQGTLHHKALCFRWFHKGRKEWLHVSEDGTVHFVRTSRTGRVVRAGPCGHWHCMEQPATDFGMARSDPRVQWLQLRDFSCTGLGVAPYLTLKRPRDDCPCYVGILAV